MKPLVALLRLDKPVGIYLLWFPCAWAIMLAYSGSPPWQILMLFALGTLVMRSAGCVINDIADMHVDVHVQRTQQRPLASLQLSRTTAFIVFLSLLSVAWIILLQLPFDCIYAAIPALGLSIIYPWCKRFFKVPQLILGFSFASSIPMVVIASHQHWSSSWTILVLITLCWVVAYDTQYALSDIKDDLKIGIFSSAIFFKQHVYLVIICLQVTMTLLWLYLAWAEAYSLKFYLAIVLGCFWWLSQHQMVKKNPLQAFKQNTWYGLWMWMAFWLEKL